MEKGVRKATGIIAAGWLIDGKGGQAVRKASIEFAQGVIRAVHREKEREGKAKPDADLSSCTILPGLMDCHVHMSMSGTTDMEARKRQLSMSFHDSKEGIEKNAASHLAHGIVAVRDGGDRLGHVISYKRGYLTGKNRPFQILSAGHAWHAAGRYGAMIGRSPSGNQTLADAICKTGTGDLIKIINSGLNSLSSFGRETLPQFDLGDLCEAVRTAHSMGLRVMVHANGKLPVKWAIEAGCDSIEHGYFMGKDNLRQMAEKRIAWVPTIFAMKALASSGVGSTEADVAKKNLDHQLEQVRLARDFEVIIAAGTDAGSLGVNHGPALVEELRLLVSAGMSVEEAVQCASSTGSMLLDLAGSGSIEPEKQAVFVAARGGPDRLPESLRFPEWVFIDGIPYKPGKIPI